MAGFIKKITVHCYTQNMKALDLVVLEKRTFLCFSHDAPGAWPVWTPGARLAGFIKRTTKHCYTLLHTKYESSGSCGFGEDFFMFFDSSLWELMAPGVGPFLTPKAWLTGIIKRIIKYIATYKISKLWALWFRRRFFIMFFP